MALFAICLISLSSVLLGILGYMDDPFKVDGRFPTLGAEPSV